MEAVGYLAVGQKAIVGDGVKPIGGVSDAPVAKINMSSNVMVILPSVGF